MVRRKLVIGAVLAAAIARATHKPFDYAVVDEAQDLSVAQLRFLAALGGGRVARVFVAETKGYWNTEMTPEDVVANFDTMMDETDYIVPASVADAGTLAPPPKG